MVILYIILGIILLLLLILLMKVVILIEIQKKEFQLNIILFGVIKINLTDKTKGRIKEKAEKQIKLKLDDIKDIWEFTKDVLPEIKYILSKITIETKLNIKFGFSSADKTAIAYGLINGIIYSNENYLKLLFRDYRGEYSIYPDFKSEEKIITGYIYLKTRFIYMIFKSLKILKKYKKRKGGVLNVRSSDRRINENYNG